MAGVSAAGLWLAMNMQLSIPCTNNHRASSVSRTWCSTRHDGVDCLRNNLKAGCQSIGKKGGRARDHERTCMNCTMLNCERAKAWSVDRSQWACSSTYHVPPIAERVAPFVGVFVECENDAQHFRTLKDPQRQHRIHFSSISRAHHALAICRKRVERNAESTLH